jgi:hypothetical protein
VHSFSALSHLLSCVEYTKDMPKPKPKKSLTPEELAREIERDEAKPSKAKKRLKINEPGGFDEVVKKISKGGK